MQNTLNEKQNMISIFQTRPNMFSQNYVIARLKRPLIYGTRATRDAEKSPRKPFRSSFLHQFEDFCQTCGNLEFIKMARTWQNVPRSKRVFRSERNISIR